jgi:hypothetical protein
VSQSYIPDTIRTCDVFRSESMGPEEIKRTRQMATISECRYRWLRVPCAVQGGAFQWVQVPPGIRSSRKQPEQAWR